MKVSQYAFGRVLKYKDINDMILSGMSKVEILNIINESTFQNLKAKMKLVEWSKV